MAATKYEVLCRYYNVDMKMPIDNIVNETWVSCFDKKNVDKTVGYYVDEVFEFFIKREMTEEENKLGQEEKEQLQNIINKQNANRERVLQDLLINGNNSTNPKFNMFFMYKSRDFQYPESSTDSGYPYALINRMERVPISPWFVHSVHGSLNSAMTKARNLSNFFLTLRI